MITVVSPAKSLDFESDPKIQSTTSPAFSDEAEKLVSVLKKKSEKELSELMSISNSLAELNAERFQNWRKNPGGGHTRPAVFAFTGDVYKGLDIRTKNKKELDYIQNRLRILSGLYGVLKPLDEIQPYRLEMGTKLKTSKGKNLYEFWGDQITKALNTDIKNTDSEYLVNLASNEYFKSIKKKQLNARIITPVFKDHKNGTFKTIAFYAKKARGLMAAFMAENKVSKPEELLAFEKDGYRFNGQLTQKETEPVFTRGGD